MGLGLLPSWRGAGGPARCPVLPDTLRAVPARAVQACFLLVNGGTFSTGWVWEVEGWRWRPRRERALVPVSPQLHPAVVYAAPPTLPMESLHEHSWSGRIFLHWPNPKPF